MRPSKRIGDPDQNDVETWWTRGEVAKILGCSVSSVITYERRNRLHPTDDRQGIKRFDPAEVRAVRARPRKAVPGTPLTKGEVEACVFSMFNRGSNLRDIVIALQIESSEVQRIWELWRAGDSLVELSRIKRRQQEDEKRAKEEAERARRRAEQQDRLKLKLAEINAVASDAGRKKK